MVEPTSSKEDGDRPPRKKEAQAKRTVWSRAQRPDKVMIGFFFVFLIIMIVLVFLSYPVSSLEDLVVLFPLLGGMIAVFFMTGIPAVWFYIMKGKISMKWLVLVVLALSFIYMVSLEVTNQNDIIPEPLNSHGVAGHLIYFYMFALAILLLYIFVAFGMMWALTFAQRLSVPDGLEEIKAITANRSKKNRALSSPRYWRARILSWAFFIPDQLDTGTLRLKFGKVRKGFPISEYLQAFGWNMLFGVFITLLLTLNPFLKDLPAFQDIFGLSAIISFFVPILVLSWFIFKRIGARIEGPVKDFRLFDGLRSRVSGSILAVSTLIIFIRISLQTMDPAQALLDFYELFIDFTAVVIITTFVYFNYFEEDVAQRVVLEKIKSP